MKKNVNSGAMWVVKGAAVLAAAVAMALLAALTAAPAWASSPSGASLQFYKYNPECGCAQEVATTQAGEKVGYEVSFTATSALSGGTANDSITISAPAGTVFPAGNEYFLANETTNVGYGLPAGAVTRTDGGATVTISLAGNDRIAIGAGHSVGVSIGLFGPEFVKNPGAAGQYTLDVHTSRDTTPATSAPYTITAADPASRVSVALSPGSIAANGSSTTTATATVTNAVGTPISGDAVSFTSDGGQQIGTTTDNGDGTYTATITSTTTPGSSTITATDASVTPNVSGTAVLTQSDNTAPTVTFVSPQNGATKVSRSTAITVTFSEAINYGSLGASTATLEKVTRGKRGTAPTYTPVPISGFSTSGNTITFRAQSPDGNPIRLQAGTTYRVTITGVEDTAGNVLDQDPNTLGNQDKVWTFKTGSR